MIFHGGNVSDGYTAMYQQPIPWHHLFYESHVNFFCLILNLHQCRTQFLIDLQHPGRQRLVGTCDTVSLLIKQAIIPVSTDQFESRCIACGYASSHRGYPSCFSRLVSHVSSPSCSKKI